MSALWVVLFLASCVHSTTAASCTNYDLSACLDIDNRPDYICGRGVCVDHQVCAWCLHTPGSTNGTCLAYDVCNPEPLFNQSHYCFGGVVLTTNGDSCSTVQAGLFVFLALLSLFPAFVMVMFINLFVAGFHAQCKPLTRTAMRVITLVSGVCVYVMLLCFMTLDSVHSWAVLLMPLFVFPLCICGSSYFFSFCLVFTSSEESQPLLGQQVEMPAK